MKKRGLSVKHIEEIKELLLANKQKIESVLERINGEYESLSEMDLNDEADFAAASRDYVTDVNIQKQQMAELAAINRALAKIASGAYDGLCEMCDSEITLARLRVKPHAVYCIDCRTYMDSKK